MDKVSKQITKHVEKTKKSYKDELNKIRETGDKVRELAKKKLKKTGNPRIDFANELDIEKKVDYAKRVYKAKAVEKHNDKFKTLEKASNKLRDKVSKKALKRNKKILTGAALLGTAAGLASNHAMKKRAKKLRGEE